MLWLVPFGLLAIAGVILYLRYDEIRAAKRSVWAVFSIIGLLCGFALGWYGGYVLGFIQGTVTNFP